MSKTLGHLMIAIKYNRQQGIWTESWDKDSQARIGQVCLENGGLNDNWIYVGNGEHLGDSRTKWTDNDPDFDDDWVDYYLDKTIEDLNRRYGKDNWSQADLNDELG